MKALAYVRVSTQEQAIEGVSLQAQLARITAYCKVANLELVQVFQDNGVSAGKPLSSREGGRELLQALAEGQADNVVVLKLDRMFRSTTDALSNIVAWTTADVGYHVVDLGGQSLNTKSAVGLFITTMLAALGELERGLISERTAQALAYKKANHQAYARTPIGYERSNGSLVPVAQELALVERIKDMHQAGESYNGIAAVLNDEGQPTKRGGRWYASTVRYIISNNLYQAA